MQVDTNDLQALKHIVIQDGFPTIAMVGIEGVHAAFLLTQHADGDPAFQETMLRIITPRLRDGGITGNEYALLTDRVLRAQGKPQRYGTINASGSYARARDQQYKRERGGSVKSGCGGPATGEV
jgi:hypothetical protein